MTNDIRPSKVVLTHGSGSIIDLQDGKSGLVMNPDYWHRYEIIKEKRLAKLLKVRYFRSPKGGWVTTSDGPRPAGVLYRRFPFLWYCPKCRRLQNSDTCMWCKEGDEKIPTIPPRLVAACEGGHLQDFPWKRWIGCDNENHVIELRPSTGESDIEICCPKCMVEKKPTEKNKSPGRKGLSGALGTLPSKCYGHRPWIGDDKANEACNRNLKGLMRGGSNVYFPMTASSILIPEYSYKIYQKIIYTDDLDLIKQLYDMVGEENPTFQEILQKKIEGYSPYYSGECPEYTMDDFKVAFMNHCKEKVSDNIKLKEWDTFKDPAAPPNEGDEYEFATEKIQIQSNPFISKYFDKVVIIKRLTEVMTLYGFTRINPPDSTITKNSGEEKDKKAFSTIRENNESKWNEIFEEMTNGDGARKRGYQGLTEIDKQTGQPNAKDKRDWLPAMKNRGEGIFFIFNKQRLNKWEKNPVWNKNVKQITNNGVQVLNIMKGVDFSNRTLLIHTFSHLLAKQIAKECGYQLASIRERLYCSTTDDTYGVLLYTSTADSQGSLGGLISQAQDLEVLKEHILTITESAKYCSQDPLCGMHNPELTRKPWGASCHSCTHIPETSCEALMNRFLDRHTISGNMREKKGYFEEA